MRTRIFRLSRFAVLLLMVSMTLAVVAAQAQSKDDSSPHPAISTIYGNTGLWKVFNATNLPPGTASFNVWYDRINRNPGFLTISTVGVSGAVGLTNWLEFGANFEINKHILARRQDQLSFGQQALGLYGTQTPGAAPFLNELVPVSVIPQLRFPATRTGAFNGTAGYFNNLPWIGSSLGSNGVGTVGLGLKFKVLSEDEGNPLGVAVRAYADIPTHRNVAFLLHRPTQTGDWVIGSDVIATKYIGQMAELNLNAGIRAYEAPGEARQLLLSDEVPLGFGLLIPRNTRIQAMGEVTADVFFGSHIPSTTFDARDPVDATVGFRAFPIPELAVSAGYRHTLNQFGGDKNGFVADISYSTGVVKKAPPSPPSVTCSADPSEVRPGQIVNLSAQAVSSTGKAITYEWSCTGGTIEGSGPTVKLHTDNLAAGAYTATVRASDMPGNSADCNTTVTVRVPPPPPQPPTVTCSADRPSVRAGEIVTLNAQGRSPQDRPLTYRWAATAGRVEGTGATVRFDTTGLQPGTYNVRATVTDDRGLSAECSLNVTVTAPPPPPPPPPPAQVSKLSDCQFRANSARVDNVCKAKLDDAALRLRNESDASLAIVGFAESRERRASQLADSRARNAKDYLVKEKGIAESRIQVRRGASGTGASARRVESHLVPRGATFNVGEAVTTPPPAAAATRRKPAAKPPAAKAPAKKSAQLDHGSRGGGSAFPALSQSASLTMPQADSDRVVIARAR
jgi:outer membrane protein OmpA-like peptidoglycan-associated protein